jgi:hypothetical protein
MPKKHSLGFGNGRIIEYEDGTAAYVGSGAFTPAFRVRIADVSGFSVTESKKMLERTCNVQRQRHPAGLGEREPSRLGEDRKVVPLPPPVRTGHGRHAYTSGRSSVWNGRRRVAQAGAAQGAGHPQRGGVRGPRPPASRNARSPTSPATRTSPSCAATSAARPPTTTSAKCYRPPAHEGRS